MALLQITEPGQSTAPHQHRLAVGIDLGTTNSLVAAVRSGMAEALCDEAGDSILPSVVRYLPGGCVVGADAKQEASEDPVNTVVSVKRFLGHGLDEIRRDNARLPYRFLQTDSPVPKLLVAGKTVTAVEVSAEILKVLRKRAERALGGELSGAVITVPAHFDDAQRQATKDAAKLAGLHVLRLLNEPTAAAVAYGLDKAGQGTVVVYDLGGGTFDVSILNLEQGVFQVLATGGDTSLGGDDFDTLIVDWILRQAGFDPDHSTSAPGKSALRRLTQAAVAAKEALSDVPSVDLAVELDDGRHWRGRLERTTFNTLIEPLVKRTLQACRRVLRDAGLHVGDIDEVVMVGGSTRVPRVRETVSKLFGRPVLTDIDPDRVVAIGAAIQADILADNKPDRDMLLLDVIPLSLGIETMGGLVEKIIPRNSTIPVARAQEFTTFKDGQRAMAIHVVQGERERVDDCRSLARFELRDIPPMVAGAARIRVTFQVDADGLLSVAAEEKTSRQAASIQVKPSFGLSDAEIAAMLRDSMAHAEDDAGHRRLKEQQVEARRVLESLDAAMRKDGDLLLDAEEKEAILAARGELASAAEGDDYRVIKRLIARLEDVSADYAARRMDAGIRRLIAGHRIDEY